MRASSFFIWLIIIGLSFLGWQRSATQPFACDDRLFFVTAARSSGSSALLQAIINSETGQPAVRIVQDNLGVALHALGYSTFDGYIYGLNTLTYELFRIETGGRVVNLGVPAGLDQTLEYFAGTVSTTGRSFNVVGRTKDTKIDRKLYNINLERITAGFVSIIADWPTQIEDIAFDPAYGVIIGYDAKTRRLVNMTPGGLVTANRFEANDLLNLESLFFDAGGDLYGVGSNGAGDGVFYRFDRASGRAKVVSQSGIPRSADGCSCPYRILFQKTVSPVQALPCTEVTYRYHLTNTAGTAFTQVEIRDTFPPDFEIVSIPKMPAIGEVQRGIGGNILHLNRMHLLLGDNHIEVKARVGTRMGVYPTQGRMGSFPAALGAQIVSTDPTLGVPHAPTVVTVIGGPEVLEDTLLYLCPGGMRLLRANFSADRFRWSTGAVTSTIEVREPGVYSVIASTECGDFFDTVRVVNVPAPLTVSLGASQIIEQGDPVVLNARVNFAEGLRYRWQSDDPTLSCTDCARPTARPVRNAAYLVTVTDANGCTASAELAVEVIPMRRIFAPTAFSPNGDGVNDIFYLQGKTDARIVYFRILDRWGNLVFQTENGYLNDPQFGWDGRWRGQIKESGSYVFVAELEFADGIKKHIAGETALLR